MTAIAIKYADDAKTGKKYGSIKDTAGTKYLVPSSMNGVFKPGMTVDVPLHIEPWTGGVQIVSGPPAAGTAPAPAAPVASAPPPPTANDPAVVAARAAADTYSDNKGGEMFITGVVGRAMGSGQFGLTDLTAMALAAAEAWRAVKGKL